MFSNHKKTCKFWWEGNKNLMLIMLSWYVWPFLSVFHVCQCSVLDLFWWNLTFFHFYGLMFAGNVTSLFHSLGFSFDICQCPDSMTEFCVGHNAGIGTFCLGLSKLPSDFQQLRSSKCSANFDRRRCWSGWFPFSRFPC